MNMLYIMYLDHTSVIYVENILIEDHHSIITKSVTLGGSIHIWNQTAPYSIKSESHFHEHLKILSLTNKNCEVHKMQENVPNA